MPSFKETPTEQIHVILQDHGRENGGWGTTALALPPIWNGPLVYGGSDEKTIGVMTETAITLAKISGKPTLLAKFTQREDVLMIEGEGERIEI